MSPATQSSCQDSPTPTTPIDPVQQAPVQQAPVQQAPVTPAKRRAAPERLPVPASFEEDTYTPKKSAPPSPRDSAPAPLQLEAPRCDCNDTKTPTQPSSPEPEVKLIPDPRTFREILPEDAPVPVRELAPVKPTPTSTPVSRPACEPTPPPCGGAPEEVSPLKRVGQILLTFLKLTFELVTLVFKLVAGILPALLKGGVRLFATFKLSPAPTDSERQPVERPAAPAPHRGATLSRPAVLHRNPTGKPSESP